ncbi:MAG: CHAT domain-containing protein [Pseudonocardiaceae bacterium]
MSTGYRWPRGVMWSWCTSCPARLVRRIAAKSRRRVELQVAQYGVTRERLADLAGEGDGWDVLHLSGHGGAGQFLLERADGSADPISTAELIGLLRPVRARVKLAVVSACQSAAATTAETLRWLGLDDPADPGRIGVGAGGRVGVCGGGDALPGDRRLRGRVRRRALRPAVPPGPDPGLGRRGGCGGRGGTCAVAGPAGDLDGHPGDLRGIG